MPSFAFLQKDESIHRNLIQKAYESLLLSENEDNLIYVILKNNKKVSVNRSIFKLFSPFISSIIGDSSSDSNHILILPDYSRKYFNCLIEILTEGTASLNTLKNIENAVEKIKSLAECLGIEMTNLVSNQEAEQNSPIGSLAIRSLSHQFIDSKVPNVLVENEDTATAATGTDEILISLQQHSRPSDDVIEIISSEEEDIYENNSEVPFEEASVCNDVHVYSTEPSSDRCESDMGTSVNVCDMRPVANNNKKSSKSFFCRECRDPREFKTFRDIRNHVWLMHRDGIPPRIECIICHNKEKFHTVAHLAEHISTKHRSYPQTCPMCNQVKKTKYKMASHIKNHHQSYKCDICSQEFKGVPNLNQYIVNKHAYQPRTLLCKLCLKKSKKISADDSA